MSHGNGNDGLARLTDNSTHEGDLTQLERHGGPPDSSQPRAWSTNAGYGSMDRRHIVTNEALSLSRGDRNPDWSKAKTSNEAELIQSVEKVISMTTPSLGVELREAVTEIMEAEPPFNSASVWSHTYALSDCILGYRDRFRKTPRSRDEATDTKRREAYSDLLRRAEAYDVGRNERAKSHWSTDQHDMQLAK